MRIAVDVGYGFSKGASETGRKISLPSTLSPVRTSRGLSEAFGDGKQRDGHDLVLTMDEVETRYTVGSVAGQRSWSSDASERAGYGPLVLTAAYMVGAEGTIDIAVGLPLSTWLQKDQRKALRSGLSDLRASVALDGKRAREIHLHEARVFPQGAGAFALAVAQDPSLAQKPTGLIDIGYRTTDYLAMRRVQGTVAPDEAACGSIDLGAGRIFANVRRALSDQTGVMVPEGAIEDALANYGGRLFLRGKEHDVTALVEAEAKLLAQGIEEQLRRLWTDRLDLMGAVLIAGGGGEMVHRHLRHIHPSTRLMRDPIYANAAGYLAMAGA